MPGRHLGYLEDAPRHDAFRRAIHAALQQMEAEDKDARVLNLGCGAGEAMTLPPLFARASEKYLSHGHDALLRLLLYTLSAGHRPPGLRERETLHILQPPRADQMPGLPPLDINDVA